MTKPIFKIGQEISVQIERLSYGGNGIAHPDGFTLFVPRTVPGDQVICIVEEIKRRYGKAMIKTIQKPSPYRITPTCKYFEQCGGCHYQHIASQYVHSQKIEQIRDCFQRIGHTQTVAIEPMISSSQQWNYRNRLTYHRSSSGNQGYISWIDHNVLNIEDCCLSPVTLTELWKKTRKALQTFTADIVSNVILRETTTQQCAIIVSVNCKYWSEHFKKELQNLFLFLGDQEFLYVTLVKPNTHSAVGKELYVLKGPLHLRERIDHHDYLVRPDLFFQIHPKVTSMLMKNILSWAKDKKISNLIDIYCGSGLFSLALGLQGICVTGVDVEFPAIQSAQLSANQLGLDTVVNFRAGKAERIIKSLRKHRKIFNAAIVDPPRNGLHPELVEHLEFLDIQHMMYISCSPPTLARDIEALKNKGFQIRKIQPYDMFPQTYHMETTVILEKIR